MIDQAWGAHLDFLPGCGAIRQGADFAVTSVHKSLLGYSQTAVVSMRENLIPRSTLDRWVDLTTTTSPSGTLLATIDGSRAAMERDGAQRLGLIIEAVADAGVGWRGSVGSSFWMTPPPAVRLTRRS